MTDTLTEEKVFPKDKVLASIDDWWADEVAQAAAFAAADEPVKAPLGSTSVLTPLKVIDSHRAVRCLLVLQDVVGKEIPEKVIQAGGYDSLDELKADLVVKLAKLFSKEK